MAKKKSNIDVGFGTKIGKSGDRLIRRDGSFNILRKGKSTRDAYQILTKMPDGQFIFTTLLFFVLINSFFAILFLLIGIEQLNGVPQGSFISNFLYAFFFSVQTFTTVGYGGINPVGISANFVASLCASVGLVAFALITGLFFARFSRPRSHISFSNQALLTPLNGKRTFQCRIVNTRDHKIMHVAVQITMTWIEEENGKFTRRYQGLKLERKSIVLFPLNWTLVHHIDEDSPIYQLSLQDLKKMHAEFMVMVSGFDESYNQSIHTNTSYICGDIAENVKFKPMYYTTGESATLLHLDELSSTEKIKR